MSTGTSAGPGHDVRETVPFVKVYDSGRDFVVVRGIRRPLRWNDVARAVCRPGRGIGASGLLVITEHRGPDFRVCAYDARGLRTRLCDSAIRCAARAIRHEYGMRRIRLGMSRFHYDIEVAAESVDVLLRHQEVPRGPVSTRVSGADVDLDVYGIQVQNEHLVAFVDGFTELPEWTPGSGLARLTLAEVLGADTVRARTFDGPHPEPPRSEDAVAALVVAGYLGLMGHPTGWVSSLDGPTRLHVRHLTGDGLSRVSGPGAVVYAGEFSWPFPSAR